MDREKAKISIFRKHKTTNLICDICGKPLNLNCENWEAFYNKGWRLYHSDCIKK